MTGQYDKIIIGAGLYGLYSALFSAKKGERVVVLEKEDAAFKRATYINQARVHMGYHYPRSYSTAVKSAGYFERFVRDYGFCIVDDFEQVYATSSRYSWSNRRRFLKFCRDVDIPCAEVSSGNFFKEGMCDGAYITKEYAYDAAILRSYLLDELAQHTDVELLFSRTIVSIGKGEDVFSVTLSDGSVLESPYVLNATYAGSNEIHAVAGFEPFSIKYELCEIILCDVSPNLRNIGLTVMDGPFFSIMPFGKTGYHSLTSVTFTPHKTSYETLPTFDCQVRTNGDCTPFKLANCNECPACPKTAFPYMSALAKKYMLDKFEFSYKGSLFSMKPILKASEIDDSRPTVIRVHCTNPTFISVLSGKINTVYDLNEVL